MRPRLLDLFCGAGGAAVGYHRAGFDVLGVDIAPQPRYPFPFVPADALAYLAAYGQEYDAIHASPPCQRYSSLSRCRPDNRHPDLVGPTRELLEQAGRPWVIENVVGAPLRDPCLLCGVMFGLRVFRHRLFESPVLLMAPPHPKHGRRRIGKDGFVCVVGHGSGNRANRVRTPADHRNKASWVRGMGVDWMSRNEMCQAIPPAYTAWLGWQLLRAIG